MRIAGKFVCGLITIFAATGYVGSAKADSTVPNNGPYGNLENSDTYGWCGATSITNSLQYLQATYPDVYGKKLVPNGDLNGARNGILSWENGVDTGTDPATGDPESNQTVWNSKVNYINEVAPGTTAFAAQIDPLLFTGTGKDNMPHVFTPEEAGYEDPNDITSIIPTDKFLQEQIEAGEDVEIGINNIQDGNGGDIGDLSGNSNPYFDDIDTADDDGQETGLDGHEVGGGHMVTLTGIDSEAGTLTYLDPNNPGKLITTDFNENSDGYLSFLWNNQGANTPGQADIYEAWAESPVAVPLPATARLGFGMLVLFGGLTGLRKRFNRNRLIA